MKYLILADVHANLPALEAVLEAEPDWDELLFLGDAVDAGPHPDGVLDVLAGCSGTFIMGNHDRSVLAEPATSPPPASRDFAQWSSAQLSPSNRAFLERFEDEQRFETPWDPIRLHHGDFSFEDTDLDWDGRPWPDTDREVYKRLATRYAEPIVLLAHSHVQFELTESGTRFINPGSVGQHRLGHIEACYAVLEDGEFALKSTGYDATRTVTAMDEVALDEAYLEERKRVYTEGVLPDDPPMRDFEPLREADYR